MAGVDTKLWQRAKAWWDEPQLMEMRTAWIDKHIDMIEDIVVTLPNGYISRNEWRATLAEAAFDTRAYRQCAFPDGPPPLWNLHQMRETWAEEAMLFFTIGQPIEDSFDLTAHGQAMERHQNERIRWRPHHRLPGPPDRLHAPVPEGGVTHQWWTIPKIQDLRRAVVTTLLVQNDTLARALTDDPEQDVIAGRDWLVGRQCYGLPLKRDDQRVTLSGEQDHFERGVFALMRGFIGEVQTFTRLGLPIQRQYEPSEMDALCRARGETYVNPYLTLGAPGW